MPFVKSMVTPAFGTLVALKCALNHKKLPAGTSVPLKFEGLLAAAEQGGGGGGEEGQDRVLLGENVMSNVLVRLVPTNSSALPDKEKSSLLNGPSGLVKVALKSPAASVGVTAMWSDTVIGDPECGVSVIV